MEWMEFVIALVIFSTWNQESGLGNTGFRWNNLCNSVFSSWIELHPHPVSRVAPYSLRSHALDPHHRQSET